MMHEVLNRRLSHVYVPCPRDAEVGNRITGKRYCTQCWEQYWELTYPTRSESEAKAKELSNIVDFVHWYWDNHIFTGPMASNGQFDDFPYAIWSKIHG